MAKVIDKLGNAFTPSEEALKFQKDIPYTLKELITSAGMSGVHLVLAAYMLLASNRVDALENSELLSSEKLGAFILVVCALPWILFALNAHKDISYRQNQ